MDNNWIAIGESCAQVTQYEYRMVQRYLNVTETTTVGDIVAWAKQCGLTSFALKLDQVESLPSPLNQQDK